MIENFANMLTVFIEKIAYILTLEPFCYFTGILLSIGIISLLYRILNIK